MSAWQFESMKKIFMSNASAMLGVPVEAWASPVKFLFPERPKEELARFIEDINEQNAEFMSYKKEFEVGVDLSPSYQQLSQDRIDDQCSKNILMLKSFEHVLEERLVAFNKFLDSLSKTRTSFDAFQSSEGSLRQALDALFVFIEQVRHLRCSCGVCALLNLACARKIETFRNFNKHGSNFLWVISRRL